MSTILQEDGAEAYQTRGGVTVTRKRRPTPYADAVSSYVDKLDERRGAVFSSNYEYPGRYTRWDTAIIDPPVVITSNAREMRIEALNERGNVLLLGIGICGNGGGFSQEPLPRAAGGTARGRRR